MSWTPSQAGASCPPHIEVTDHCLEEPQRRHSPHDRRLARAQSAHPHAHWSDSRQPAETLRWRDRLSFRRLLSDSDAQRSLSDTRLRAGASEMEGRSYVGVLRRISCMLSSAGPQTPSVKVPGTVRDAAGSGGRLSDLDLRQHWLPDSVSRECYDCCEKFTTFRRRHHCRICGQIFCWRCCNQQIPGRVLGCSGELRVCTYCCKVVMTYVQSIVDDGGGSVLMPDLRKVLERVSDHLETAKQLGGDSAVNLAGSIRQQRKGVVAAAVENERLRRTSSISHEDFVHSSDALEQDLTYLNTLVHMIIDPICGVGLTSHRHRLKNYRRCLVGSEVVDWLVSQGKCSKRWQAVALGQRLVESGLLECASHSDPAFRDDYLLYRPSSVALRRPALVRPPEDQMMVIEEPHWLSQIELNEDDSRASTSETLTIRPLDTPTEAVGLGSSYNVRLDVQFDAATMSRSSAGPPQSSELKPAAQSNIVDSDSANKDDCGSCSVDLPMRFLTEPSAVDADMNRHRAASECDAAFESLESSMLSQLLDTACLSPKWYETLVSLSRSVSRQVRPDVRYEADCLDIRRYVKIKRIPGGRPADSSVVSGTVFTQNIVHNEMRSQITNPQILLINGDIAYQRYQDRLTSLEPMIMQEREVLKNVTSMLVAFEPDVVIVEKHVESLARDMLLKAGVTLMSNTKRRNLLRISRCTQAGIMGCVDAQLAKPALGICHQFYTKQFTMEGGNKKNIVFFDGCPSHLGCTVLLRGGHMNQLRRVKHLLRFMISVHYNWLLLRGYFRDLGALPPSFGSQAFLGEKDLTEEPHSHTSYLDNTTTAGADEVLSADHRKSYNLKSPCNIDRSCDEAEIPTIFEGARCKTPVDAGSQHFSSEIVTDKSDPLQCETTPVSTAANISTEAEVKTVYGGSNGFRYLLTDTIVCTTPYARVEMPYLETKEGKQCSLRRFFPKELFWSLEFNKTEKARRCPIRRAPIEIRQDNSRIENHVFLKCDLYKKRMQNEDYPQTLLSDFRARGNVHHSLGKSTLSNSLVNLESSNQDLETDQWISPYDCLSPLNHQRIAVHSYSYCKLPNGESLSCNDSQVNLIFFNGEQDTTLGLFLEVHCFSDSFKCMRKLCNGSSETHIQSFLHDEGCLLRTQRSLKEACPDSRIWMWTRCDRCGTNTSAAPMSEDTWSLSFGKFLEAFFVCEQYTSAEGCKHSLFRDFHHFFALGTNVVVFKYRKIQLNDIVLPPVEVSVKLKTFIHDKLSEELELMSNCVQLFSDVYERLLYFKSFCNDAKFMELIRTEMNNCEEEKTSFRNLQSEIEDLASPYVGKAGECPVPSEESAFIIIDRSVLARRVVDESARKWKLRFNELSKTAKMVSKTKTEDLSNNCSDKDLRKSSSNKAVGQDSVFEQCHSGSPENAGNDINTTDELDKISSSKVKTITAGGIKALKSFGKNQMDFGERQLSPLGVNVHYRLPPTDPPSFISGDDNGSIISYCLLTQEYSTKLSVIQDQLKRQSEESNKCGNSDESVVSAPMRVVSRLRHASGNSSVYQSESSVGSDHNDTFDKSVKQLAQYHIEINISDESANFYCQVMLAEHFRRLREVIFPEGEERFVRSLMQCRFWNAKGGKSGSTFQKSSDDRFIIKTISRIEKDHVVRIGSKYVDYVLETISMSRPCALAKIFGVYLVGYKNNVTSTAHKAYVIVMENLFYGYRVSQKFDLKGSLRNRLADTREEKSDVVLMDQNVLTALNENPFYVRTHSKRVLMGALSRDTQFLQNCQVMDYSLLVAIDESRDSIVVGIIDYLRSYTYDKAMETYIKSYNVFLGDGDNRPTVLDPVRYKARFLDMMNKYFTDVPDRWFGFTQECDSS